MCKAKAPRPRVFVVECGGRALHSLIIDQHRPLLRGPFGCWLRSANLVINLRALRDHHHHHQHTHTHGLRRETLALHFRALSSALRLLPTITPPLGE